MNNERQPSNHDAPPPQTTHQTKAVFETYRRTQRMKFMTPYATLDVKLIARWWPPQTGRPVQQKRRCEYYLSGRPERPLVADCSLSATKRFGPYSEVRDAEKLSPSLAMLISWKCAPMGPTHRFHLNQGNNIEGRELDLGTDCQSVGDTYPKLRNFL